jgi:hypothetical protein
MRWIVVVLTSLGLVGALKAQRVRERDDVHLRNDCRFAAQVLTTGEPAPHHDWAVAYSDRCDESGPPALAALWRRLSDDRTELGRVTYKTSSLRDQRLLDAMVATARDRSRPTLVRLATFQVLMSYFDTATYMPLEDLERPPVGSPLSFQFDFVAEDGAQPLSASAPDTILAVLHELAAGDPDPTVQHAARFVARGLEVRRRTLQRRGGP